MRVMVRVAAGALVFVLIFSSVALATPGKSNGHRTDVQTDGRSLGSARTGSPGRASSVGVLSATSRSHGRPLETSQTSDRGKGRSKFQLEGSIVSTGADFLTVKIKAGTNSIRWLKGQDSVIEVTGNTKITLKGKVATVEQILEGDSVHVGGTVDSSGDVPQLVASRIIIRPRRTGSGGSIEDSSTPDGSGETSLSVDSSDSTALGVNHGRFAGSETVGSKIESAAHSIVSWFLSLL